VCALSGPNTAFVLGFLHRPVGYRTEEGWPEVDLFCFSFFCLPRSWLVFFRLFEKAEKAQDHGHVLG